VSCEILRELRAAVNLWARVQPNSVSTAKSGRVYMQDGDIKPGQKLGTALLPITSPSRYQFSTFIHCAMKSSDPPHSRLSLPYLVKYSLATFSQTVAMMVFCSTAQFETMASR